MTGSSLRQRLRAETQAVHERLHRDDHFAAIADGSILAQDFDQLMARMGGFYRALDPIMMAVCHQTGQKAGGYAYHARAPMFTGCTGTPDLPRIAGLGALAGAAYVVDGSVLGGQILRRAIAGRLSHPYWDWCAVAGASVWRATRALIDTADQAAVGDEAVKAANAVFLAFSEHMNMSEAEVAA